MIFYKDAMSLNIHWVHRFFVMRRV